MTKVKIEAGSGLAAEYIPPSKNVLDKGFVRLVDSMGNDASIVQAARVSYGPGTKTLREDTALIRYLLRHRHTSVFEQVIFKFHVKAPIFIIRQWFRHRTFSVNELSLRYSEAPTDFYLPDPSKIEGQHPVNRQSSGAILDDATKMAAHSTIRAHSETALREYQQLIHLGVSREMARIVLPTNWYSEFYATIDLHNLMHFLALRLKPNAQWEIQEYARAILALIEPIVPASVHAFMDYSYNNTNLSGPMKKALHTYWYRADGKDTYKEGLSKSECLEAEELVDFIYNRGIEHKN